MTRSIKFLLAAALSLISCDAARAAGPVKLSLQPKPVSHKPVTPAFVPPMKIKQPTPQPLAKIKQPTPQPLAKIKQPTPQPLVKIKQPTPQPLVKIKQPTPLIGTKPQVASVASNPAGWYHKVGQLAAITANYPKFSQKVWNKNANSYCYFDPCTHGWYGWSGQQNCYLQCAQPLPAPYPASSGYPTDVCSQPSPCTYPTTPCTYPTQPSPCTYPTPCTYPSQPNPYPNPPICTYPTQPSTYPPQPNPYPNPVDCTTPTQPSTYPYPTTPCTTPSSPCSTSTCTGQGGCVTTTTTTTTTTTYPSGCCQPGAGGIPTDGSALPGTPDGTNVSYPNPGDPNLGGLTVQQ